MAALTPPYSTIGDLLIDEADLILGETYDRQGVIDTVAREMDGKLGFMYRLPLTPDPSVLDDNGVPLVNFPKHESDLLFTINNKMASGRILQGMKGSGDSNSQHAWGKQLCDEAEALLNMLASGDLELSALRKGGPTHPGLDTKRGPKVINEDAFSMRRDFENQVFRNQPSYTYPGPVI